MELHIVSEANRCLNCKKPMCQQGISLALLQLIKQNVGRLETSDIFLSMRVFRINADPGIAAAQ